ncbi:MAG: hypothetical protein ONB23_02130 [candidate division KSB1 bacterium]|nr:hypothetical protein [candidate division KSB1 bacterium]
MKIKERLALVGVALLLVVVGGCYTQVGRPKVKTEGDVTEGYYLEEREEGERPDTVVYHRHDVYFHPPLYYRPMWIDYWWWDAWSWYYDPYWYWRRGFVPGYYVGVYFGWGDPWWPYWGYPYWGADVFYWRPASYYGGWAFYYSYRWWDYEPLEPAKRRPFTRRHFPPLGATGVAVRSSAIGTPGISLERRTLERRTTTAHESPATISKDRVPAPQPSTGENLRRIQRTETPASLEKPIQPAKPEDVQVRQPSSPARRTPSQTREVRREKSSDTDERRSADQGRPRVSQPAPPPTMEPAPPPRRSSGSEGSSQRRRSEYSPSFQRAVPSQSSAPRMASPSQPVVRRAAPPPPPSSGDSGSPQQGKRRQTR